MNKCCNCLHNEKQIEKLRKGLPNEEELSRLSNIFKAVGDPTRLKILLLLSQSEMAVMDISASLDMSQSAISHQLKTLKQERLVAPKRDGKYVYYSLFDDHVRIIINQTLEHIRHT